MLTRQGIANALIEREWHCPFCINRAIDAIETNFRKGSQYSRDLGINDVRLYNDVSKSGIGMQANLGVHTMLRHEGPLWAPVDVPYATS